MKIIDVDYNNNGVCYSLRYKNKNIDFPLSVEDKLYRKILKTQDVTKLQLLEELWYQDYLQQLEDGVYLLNPDNIYLLDEEDYSRLELPTKQAKLELVESGNIGSDNYELFLECSVGGNRVGRYIRKSCYIITEFEEIHLSKGQYRIAELLDKFNKEKNIIKRGRNLAKIKKMALNSGVALSTFTESRDFYIAENIKANFEYENDQLISLLPEIDEVPLEVVEAIEEDFSQLSQMNIEGKPVKVFFDEASEKTFKNIRKNRKIEGINVPQFIENPMRYIPEDCEFDLGEFADRVKGFKIIKSKAIPTININPTDNQVGWFDVDLGYSLEIENKEENINIDEFELFNKLSKEAVERNENFIYFDNKWIKIDTKQYNQIVEEKERLEEEFPESKIPQNKLRTVLDIFDNIEGVEYDEKFKERKQQYLKSNTYYQIPNYFKGVLKNYQDEGYQFLRNQYEKKQGALLADDMGLGKTVQVICLLSYLKEKELINPAIIVMPASLIDNWSEEIKKFCPYIKDEGIYTHQGAKRYKDIEVISKFDIVLTTYETLARDQMILGKIKWKVMVCDESQKIKNFKTLAASAIKAMNVEYKIAMTGTPVENRLSELWSIVDFVQPGLLKNYNFFKKHYEEPIQENIEANKGLTQELINTIELIFLRRTKEEVLAKELPEKKNHKNEVLFTPMQKDMYLEIVDALKNEENNLAVISVIQKLIMLCGHPSIFEEENISSKKLLSESNKLKYTIDLLNTISKLGDKVIIFTSYKKLQQILRKVIFEKFGIDAKIINGEVAKGRVEEVNRFNNTKGFNVMILSPKAAGVGLNITGANHVIHYTREWNPAIEAQATDRVYRIGQTKQVNVYYPICKSEGMVTVEEKLDMLLEGKKKLMENVIIPSGLEIDAIEFKEALIS